MAEVCTGDPGERGGGGDAAVGWRLWEVGTRTSGNSSSAVLKSPSRVSELAEGRLRFLGPEDFST